MKVTAYLRETLRELVTLFSLVPAARRVLVVLIVADTGLIALHILRAIAMKYEIVPLNGLLEAPQFAIDVEGSWPENWQQAQALATAVLLALATLRMRGAAVYGAWAALFAYAALDDHLAFHERGGDLLAAALGLPRLGDSHGHNLGELLFTGAAGVILVAAILLADRHSAPNHRARSGMFLFPLAGLAMCGIGVDLLHSVIGYRWAGSNLILTVLEDGGEMLSMSLACALAFAVFRQAVDTPAALSGPPAWS